MTINKQEADAIQANLTKSIGQTLTRESPNAELPRWKRRWWKKADAARP